MFKYIEIVKNNREIPIMGGIELKKFLTVFILTMMIILLPAFLVDAKYEDKPVKRQDNVDIKMNVALIYKNRYV